MSGLCSWTGRECHPWLQKFCCHNCWVFAAPRKSKRQLTVESAECCRTRDGSRQPRREAPARSKGQDHGQVIGWVRASMHIHVDMSARLSSYVRCWVYTVVVLQCESWVEICRSLLGIYSRTFGWHWRQGKSRWKLSWNTRQTSSRNCALKKR